MEEVEIPEFLSSEFIQNVASNPDVMKIAFDDENEDADLVVKGGHFKISDISKISKLKLVLCDVKIEVKNSKCTDDICKKNTESCDHKTDENSKSSCTESTHHKTHTSECSSTDKETKLLFNIDRNNNNEATYFGKIDENKLHQGKYDQMEEIKKSLEEAKKSRVEIENLEKELNKKNKSLKVSEELLRHEQEKKIVIQARIDQISKMLNHSHKSFESRLIDLYKKEMTTLKNNLSTKTKQIKEIEKSLNEKQDSTEAIKKEINKKTTKLFENLFNYNI